MNRTNRSFGRGWAGKALVTVLSTGMLLAGGALGSWAAQETSRQTIDDLFAATAGSWAAKEFDAVRAACNKVLAMTNAPAQSYLAQGMPNPARSEYEKIAANADYPASHRYEAEDCIKELDRVAKGLPA